MRQRACDSRPRPACPALGRLDLHGPDRHQDLQHVGAGHLGDGSADDVREGRGVRGCSARSGCGRRYVSSPLLLDDAGGGVGKGQHAPGAALLASTAPSLSSVEPDQRKLQTGRHRGGAPARLVRTGGASAAGWRRSPRPRARRRRPPSRRSRRGRLCQWQPKTAHFWQLKTAHFWGGRRGRIRRSPVEVHRAFRVGRRERSDRSPARNAARRCPAGGHVATPSRRLSAAVRSHC